MRPTITKEQIERIHMLVDSEYSIKDIVDDVGVSKRCVLNYKREYLASKQNIDDDKQALYFTKKEKEYFKNFENNSLMYEDDTEGWIFHISKQKRELISNGKYWWCIVYPESLPSSWERDLYMCGVDFCRSPLHDKDVWEHDSPEKVDPLTGELRKKGELYKKGDFKKAHWHIICAFTHAVSFEDATRVLQMCLHCPLPQKVRSLIDAHNYHVHNGKPDKYQYNPEEEYISSCFVFECSSFEKKLAEKAICEWIEDNQIETYYEVYRHYAKDPIMLNIVLSKPNSICKICSDIYKKHHRELKRVNYTVVVNSPDDILKFQEALKDDDIDKINDLIIRRK